jgi:hypothetical protein
MKKSSKSRKEKNSQRNCRVNSMAFNEIIEIEPELRQLKDEALEIMANSPGNYWQRSHIWYHELKPQFIHLVGFMAEKPELQTTEVYDAAYMGFLEILKI